MIRKEVEPVRGADYKKGQSLGWKSVFHSLEGCRLSFLKFETKGYDQEVFLYSWALARRFQ